MIKIEKQVTQQNDDYAGMTFVLSGMSKDKGQYNLKETVFFDGSCFWSTDGHRLHFYYIKNNGMEPGVYDVISKDKKTIVLEKSDKRFPDISLLDLWRFNPKEELEMTLQKGQINSIQYSRIIKKMEPEVTIDYRFFDALPEGFYRVFIGEYKETMVLFCNHDKGAAIIPLPIKRTGGIDQ